jgi:hypothetical protein
MKFLIIIYSLLHCLELLSQSQTNNPYSSLGLGEQAQLAHGQFGAIGNASVCYVDSMTANSDNPSSYSFLSKGYPLFGAGFSGNRSMVSANGTVSNFFFVNFSNLSLSIPLKYGLGTSLGMKPYIRKGYDFKVNSLVGVDSVKSEYIGNGGQQLIYLGLAWMPIRTKAVNLGFGINGDYIFGRGKDLRYSSFYDGNGAVAIKTNYISDINFTLGTYGSVKISNNLFKANHYIGFGATYVPSKQMDLKQENGLYAVELSSNSAKFIENEAIYDTVSFSRSNGTVNLSSDFRIGGAYSCILKSKKRPMFRVFGQYAVQNLSEMEIEIQGTIQKPFSLNQSQISLGFEYKPKSNTEYKELKLEYLKRMTYRVGYFSASLPYAFNGKQYVQNGLTAGLALPIGSASSRSSFNLSLQYGKRSAGTGSIEQNLLNFSVGVIVAPTVADRWFRKYKLD